MGAVHLLKANPERCNRLCVRPRDPENLVTGVRSRRRLERPAEEDSPDRSVSPDLIRDARVRPAEPCTHPDGKNVMPDASRAWIPTSRSHPVTRSSRRGSSSDRYCGRACEDQEDDENTAHGAPSDANASRHCRTTPCWIVRDAGQAPRASVTVWPSTKFSSGPTTSDRSAGSASLWPSGYGAGSAPRSPGYRSSSTLSTRPTGCPARPCSTATATASTGSPGGSPTKGSSTTRIRPSSRTRSLRSA